MEKSSTYKSLILVTFYEKTKASIKKTHGYYYSSTESVNHFKFLWPVRSLKLQADISDKLCTLRSHHSI